MRRAGRRRLARADAAGSRPGSPAATSFPFWGQAFALVPGLPGKYPAEVFLLPDDSDRARCDCDIGFLSYFSDRRSEVGRGVYVGFGVSVGLASLGDGCLVGSRASIINGGWQHRSARRQADTLRPRIRPCVRIGEETWIGEGAIVMADVGSRCIIGAGSVVSEPVPDGCLVAGNPARFLRRLVEDTPARPETATPRTTP